MAGVGSWIFSRKLIPTRPECPSLARNTSTNPASTASACRSRSAAAVYIGMVRNAAPRAFPPGTRYVSRTRSATSGAGKRSMARRRSPFGSPSCSRRTSTASSAVPDTTPSWPSTDTARASRQLDTAAPIPPCMTTGRIIVPPGNPLQSACRAETGGFSKNCGKDCARGRTSLKTLRVRRARVPTRAPVRRRTPRSPSR